MAGPAPDRIPAVDLSGGATTSEDYPGTSLLAAYQRFKAAEEARAQDAVKSSLDTFYRGMGLSDKEIGRRRRKAAKRASRQIGRARVAVADTTPEAIEELAMKKGEKAFHKALVAGASAAQASDAGFERYQRHGGKQDRTTFVRGVFR